MNQSIRYASSQQIQKAHAKSLSMLSRMFARTVEKQGYIDQGVLGVELLDWQGRLQDHYQHMRDEQSHPEDDSVDYDD